MPEPSFEIRRLRRSDDRKAFRSGDSDLDSFLHKYAAQNQLRHYIGVTYVAAIGARLLGYASVAPGSMEYEQLPPAAARRLPRYPVPILRLTRLAVDQSVQGHGIGTELLRHVLQLARSMSKDLGYFAVVVDAKPGAVAYYARYGFESLELLEGTGLARPEPTPMILPISDIIAAAPESG